MYISPPTRNTPCTHAPFARNSIYSVVTRQDHEYDLNNCQGNLSAPLYICSCFLRDLSRSTANAKISNSIWRNAEKINFERYPRKKDGNDRTSNMTDPSVTRISCSFEFLYRNENSRFLSVLAITTKLCTHRGSCAYTRRNTPR